MYKLDYLPLISISLGFFMVIIDVTIINVALPTLAQSLHASISGLQWVVDGYSLTFACLLLSAGHLADIIGAKTSFVYGLIAFSLFSLLCGIAPNITMLVIFRLFQGISAAILIPTSLVLINSTYLHNKSRTQAIGIWASLGGIAFAIGPFIGGILTTYFSWRSVFFVNLPIGLLSIYLVIKYVINNNKSKQSHFDVGGQLAIITSISALAFSLIDIGFSGLFSLSVISSFILFIVFLGLFIGIEKRSKSPMLPLNLFRSAPFTLAIVLGLLLNTSLYGLFFALPLYFQSIKGYSILLTGIAILPMPSLMIVGNLLSSKLINLKSAQFPIQLGFIITTLGFILLSFAILIFSKYSLMFLALLAIGFGCSLIVPGLTVVIIHVSPSTKTGIAAGALNASRQIGSLIGVALFGSLLNIAPTFIRGMGYGLLMNIIIFLFSSILVYTFNLTTKLTRNA